MKINRFGGILFAIFFSLVSYGAPTITSPPNGTDVTTSDDASFKISGACDSGATSITAWPIAGTAAVAKVTAACTSGKYSLAINFSTEFAAAPVGGQTFKVSLKDNASSDAVNGYYGKSSVTDAFISRYSGFKFTHPGVLSSADDLTYVRGQITKGLQPWTDQLGKPAATPPAYTSHAIAHPCAGLSGQASTLCPDPATFFSQLEDANRAYQFALIAAVIPSAPSSLAYAKAAEKILDAWSAVFEGEGGETWYLGSGWIGALWGETAELVRYADPDWAGVTAFGKMLNDYVLPYLHNRIAFGNRELAVANALVAIGVFNNNAAAFGEGMTNFDNYVRAYFYMAGDTTTGQPLSMNYYLYRPTDAELEAVDKSTTTNKWTSYTVLAKQYETNTSDPLDPLPPSLGDDHTSLEEDLNNPATLWNAYAGSNPKITKFLSGYSAEVDRDLGHAQMALGSAINIAEIAWHQNIDVYSPNAERLLSNMELIAGWLLGDSASPLVVVSNDVATFEVGFNHLHYIMGLAMPNTQQLITIGRNVPSYGSTGYQNGTICTTWTELLSSAADHLCVFQMTSYNVTAGGGVVGAPTTAISSTYPMKASTNGKIPITVTFKYPVTGFSLAGVTVVNGTATGLTGSGTTYTFDVVPAAKAFVVSVSVKGGVAHGAVTTGSPNPNPNLNSVQLDFVTLFSRTIDAQTAGYINEMSTLSHGDLNKADATYP